MKTLAKKAGWAVCVLLAAMVWYACDDVEDAPPGNEDPVTLTPEEADAIMENLTFKNGTKVTGAVPPVTDTDLVRANNKDTIYTMPGMELIVRLTNPSGRVAAGWYITSAGSSFYYNVQVDEVEDDDTVTLVTIGFPEDNSQTEAPYSFPIEITTYDESGAPIDIIERTVTVEEPNTTTPDGCNLLVSGDTSTLRYWEWAWHWTRVTNQAGEVRTFGPGRVYKAEQNPSGCCEDGSLCPLLRCNPNNPKECVWEYNAMVFATTYYSIEYEFFNFYEDGTYTRLTGERIRNFNPDPDVTDWCGNVPGYNDRSPRVFYHGTHNYVPGNTNILYATNRVDCDDPLGICGYASRPGAIKTSCHILLITVDKLMIDNSYEERMYVRHPVSIWYR